MNGDPRRVHTLADLSQALELLRARAARGSHKTKISLAELAKRVAEPRSTIHSYVTGRHLAPPDVLDRIVTALGATSEELREWGEAWFRVSADQDVRKLARGNNIPRELPADVPEFTGRAAELVELNRLLAHSVREPTAVVLSAVAGMAGVGKTALAVHWGRTVTDEFPDGCLYVDLRGYDPAEPMRPGDVLAGFLRALGANGVDIPYGQAERAARYRTMLEGRRMLIVLDNARNTEQVRPLLPGTASCFVLVTSRDRLSGLVARHGARRIELDPLPSADATALLRTLVGPRIDADPVAAGRLATYCAHLPLALRITAESAAARPGMTLADLADELADEQRRLELLRAGNDARTAVRTVFSWSYDHLAADVARVFRLLGLHPGTEITVPATACLAGIDDAAANRLLDALADAHLLQANPPHGYRMHDLLRTWARERATIEETEADRRAAVTRLFDHYLRTAAGAVRLLYPHERTPGPPAPVSFADEAAARRWLAAERANLVAVTAHAARNGWPAHAIQLSAVLHRHLYVAADFTTAQAVHEHALAVAHRHGTPADQARALHDLGSTLAAVGEYDQSVQHLERALALHRDAGDRAREARALSNLGTTYWRSARYEPAAAYLTQAVAIYREVHDPAGEVRALINLGAMCWRFGDYDQGADHFRAALALCDRLGIREGWVQAMSGLGAVNWRHGRYEQARDQLTRAYELAVEIGDRYGEAVARTFLGPVCARTGDPRHGVEHLERAVALWHASGDRDGQADALSKLGDVHNLVGRHDLAEDRFYEALRLFRACGNRTGLAMAWNGLGETASATAALLRAARAHEQAREHAAEVGDRDQLARAHRGAGHVQYLLGNLPESHTHWRQTLALYEELDVPEAEEIRAML